MSTRSPSNARGLAFTAVAPGGNRRDAQENPVTPETAELGLAAPEGNNEAVPLGNAERKE
jgi:hypothetical protein